MNDGWDEVIYDFQLRAFGEELTRVNQLPVEQRRAYVRNLWQKRVNCADPADDSPTGSTIEATKD